MCQGIKFSTVVMSGTTQKKNNSKRELTKLCEVQCTRQHLANPLCASVTRRLCEETTSLKILFLFLDIETIESWPWLSHEMSGMLVHAGLLHVFKMQCCYHARKNKNKIKSAPYVKLLQARLQTWVFIFKGKELFIIII